MKDYQMSQELLRLWSACRSRLTEILNNIDSIEAWSWSERDAMMMLDEIESELRKSLFRDNPGLREEISFSMQFLDSLRDWFKDSPYHVAEARKFHLEQIEQAEIWLTGWVRQLLWSDWFPKKSCKSECGVGFEALTKPTKKPHKYLVEKHPEDIRLFRYRLNPQWKSDV